MRRILISLVAVIISLIIIIIYLVFFGENDLLMDYKMSFELKEEKPWKFLLDLGPWPIIHLENNVLLTLFLTQNPIFTFIIATLWEFLETLVCVIISTFFYLISNKIKNTNFIDFFYESAADSIIGDLLQCFLGICLSLLILYVLKIKKFSNQKYEWLWSGSKYCWYKRDYYFQTKIYASVLFLVIISYGSCFNFDLKNKTIFSSYAPVGFIICFLLEILLISIIRHWDIYYLKNIYKIDYIIIEKYENLYDIFTLFILLVFFSSIFLSQNPYISSWISVIIFFFLCLYIK